MIWLLAAAFAAAALPKISHAAQDSQPFFKSDYRGDPKVVLAWVDDQPITETDLYYFLLLARMPNPDFAWGWRAKTEPELAGSQRELIRRGVKLLVLTRMISQQRPPAAAPFTEFTTVRWILYPIYTLLWTDQVVAPEIQITSEDLLYYIRNNEKEFSLPERAQFYWAYFPVRPDAGPEARRGERTLAEQALARLRATNASLAAVAADYPPSTTLQAQTGGLYTIAFDHAQIDPILEAQLRLNPSGQPSGVVETRDGFHILELHARLPATLRPDDEIREEARFILFHRFLPQQFDYRLAELRRKIHPVNRVNLWPFLDEDTVMLDIGPTELNKREFRDLFPQVFTSAATPAIQTLRNLADELVNNELIAQDIETRQLGERPALRDSRSIARSIFATSLVLKDAAGRFTMPSDAELDRLWEVHRAILAPGVERHYYRLGVSLRRKGGLLPPPADQQRIYRALLKDLRDQYKEFSEVLGGLRAASTTNAPLNADLMLSRWKPGEKELYEKTFSDLGFQTAPAPGPLALPRLDLPALAPGEVSPPRYEEPGVVAMYFVTEERPAPAPPLEQRRQLVADYLRQNQLFGEAQATLEEMRQSGRFHWNPEIRP